MLRFWRMTPLDLGRDLNIGLWGEGSADPSTVIGLWASGSDSGESCAAVEHCIDSDSELGGSEDSVHQVGSGGADKISDESG